MAMGVISVSFAAVFIRLAEAPPLVIAAYRMCSASLIIVLLALVRSGNELRRLSRQNIIMMLLSRVFQNTSGQITVLNLHRKRYAIG